MSKRCVKKLSGKCYETLSSASTIGFDAQNSDVEARLRYILPMLPKSMRVEYADSVWGSLGAAIGWRDDDRVAASDRAVDADGSDGEITKSVTKIADWYVRTDRFISVVSELIPGYEPPKRFPASGVKREGALTVVWWDGKTCIANIKDQLADQYLKMNPERGSP